MAVRKKSAPSAVLPLGVLGLVEDLFINFGNDALETVLRPAHTSSRGRRRGVKERNAVVQRQVVSEDIAQAGTKSASHIGWRHIMTTFTDALLDAAEAERDAGEP